MSERLESAALIEPVPDPLEVLFDVEAEKTREVEPALSCIEIEELDELEPGFVEPCSARLDQPFILQKRS